MLLQENICAKRKEPNDQKDMYGSGYGNESITSVMPNLGASGYFHARTCGIHLTGAKFWFGHTNTVQIVFGYEIDADLTCYRGAGPAISDRNTERKACDLFLCRKDLYVFNSHTRGP